ncbi:MAG: DUF2537 domain-containing protein [Mycobacteriaceae bacterium]
MVNTQTETPWATGITLSAFVAVLSSVAAFDFGLHLVEINIWLALLLNSVAVAGALPVLLQWRYRPILRWIFWGMLLGVLLGWCGLILGAL